MAESNPQPTYLAGAPGASLKHLNTAGGTLLKTGAGAAVGINVNTSSANATLTIYDGTSAAGAVMAVIDASRGGPDIGFTGWPFTTGLFVVVVGTPDITITWW